MKKIFGIASIMLGMVAMTGCDDFLDQNSPSEQNTETVYNSTYYTGYVINKIYGGIQYEESLSNCFDNRYQIVSFVRGMGLTYEEHKETRS